MFKKTVFQLHWLFGITAGLVLALMGATGALWSFQDELLRLFNPDMRLVEPHASERLAPAELIRRVETAEQDRVSMLWVDLRQPEAARVFFTPAPGERRGALRYADPYTGALKDGMAGQDFFDLMLRLHRFLAMGPTGRQITGACTLMLVFFCLSGLYLRWPRHALNWRTWLTIDGAKRGRAFHWDLHAVAGTWCLLFYLLFALTGLFWSYEWYRQGLNQLLADAPVAGASGQARAARGQPPASIDSAQAPRTPTNPDALWQTLRAAAGPGLAAYNLRLPMAAGQPAMIFYLLDGAPHERAFNTLTLDPVTGAIRQHERFDDKSAKAQLLASVYALHVGSYFGLPGRILVTLASLTMPLFFVTGWLLYLDRRRKQRQARAARGHVQPVAPSEDSWLIGYASQSGFAEQLAWQSAGQLQAAGLSVQVHPLRAVDEQMLRETRRALFVLSTFGDGEPPDSARLFERQALGQAWSLAHLSYAVLALGDRQYPAFCGFARRVQAWLDGCGARQTFATVDVDNADPVALGHWQQALANLTGVRTIRAWKPPSYGHWVLRERVWLNPGSQGAPVFRLALSTDTPTTWVAGDLVEVLPRNGHDAIQAFVTKLGLQADAPVQRHGVFMRLEVALAGVQLPTGREHLIGLQAQAVLDALAPIGPRDYSIASIASDGWLELIVRQTRDEHGVPGLGSGWLTEHLAEGGVAALRVRRNSGFHLPDAPAPMILIGNGTGLAGLRSLLKARIVAGDSRNWLLFGERQRDHDFYCAHELEQWLHQGDLAHLDLAFSRDQAEKYYVQDALRAQADRLRAWVDEGAYLYLCGSQRGMASGVDTVLNEVLGRAEVQALIEEGRYRRDVY
ncbi:flavodoxin [Pseudomonas entomophila]|uniref:PepSY domain-containing protein n=1 Tax=Pseudomonas entomophila TaxID=312306 RepID=UPI0015E32BD8|nr:sulfite reductase flavoprotein subunit alpha [Pseudomonas entomophila]MBA1194671.1 flavodoxin [Pseudomonas entomophila]